MVDYIVERQDLSQLGYCTAVIRLLRPEFKFPAKIEITFSQMLAIRLGCDQLQ